MIKVAALFSLVALTACDAQAMIEAAASQAASQAASATPAGQDPLAPAAAPVDPLDDSGKALAICDRTKTEIKTCVEYYDLGLAEEVDKQSCESEPNKGVWRKGQACPKEGRVDVCRTDTTRAINYLPQRPEDDALCESVRLGKLARYPKASAANTKKK